MKVTHRLALSNPFVLAGAAALGVAGLQALLDRRADEKCATIFQDQVVIVTGGASGIGRALCEALGHRGATVTVADINAADAGQVALAITSAGGRARVAHLDVAQAQDVQGLVDETISEHGRLDYMFNNAGVAIIGDARDMEIEHWRRTLDVNLWGIIHGTTAAYRVMSQQGSGHIVNTASAAALIAVPMATAYTSSKHAVLGLSTSLRAEAAGLGVKVSVVCPGLIQTDMFETSQFIRFDKLDREQLISLVTSYVKVTDAAACARAILRGVARDKAIIPVTAAAHILWWVYRLHPTLLDPVLHTVAQELRARRSEP
jgi:NAD(P)-dependent dehydrogenase (short-subunit alcohol dehydrogenase family)